MKTRFLIILLVFVTFLSILSSNEVQGRSIGPFSFQLDETTIDDKLFFYVDGVGINLEVDKGESATFSLTILSGASESTPVDFHATIDNDQMGSIRFPPGVNIKLEPSHMILERDVNQILNITVIVADKAPSSKYDVKLVGVWKDEGKIPDFKGTSFSLHVGKDFGHDAIPVNFFMAPLKFYKEGASYDEIICRNNLILILKYDDKPACVTHETKAKLISRGWMKTQVNIDNDSDFIEASKKIEEVQLFLTQHPNAVISVDHEWNIVSFEESGFRQHPTSSIIHHTKRLNIGLNYEGKPLAESLECGGRVSLLVSTNVTRFLNDSDWCFPADQTPFQNLKNEYESKPDYLCNRYDGRWDDEHLTCDYVDADSCIAMKGEFQECKTPEYRCPHDNPECFVTAVCFSSCIFEYSLQAGEKNEN